MAEPNNIQFEYSGGGKESLGINLKNAFKILEESVKCNHNDRGR